MQPSTPPATRECLDCGAADGMKLHNVVGSVPRNIPLLYVCKKCGATLTIPPPSNPLEPVRGGD